MTEKTPPDSSRIGRRLCLLPGGGPELFFVFGQDVHDAVDAGGEDDFGAAVLATSLGRALGHYRARPAALTLSGSMPELSRMRSTAVARLTLRSQLSSMTLP